MLAKVYSRWWRIAGSTIWAAARQRRLGRQTRSTWSSRISLTSWTGFVLASTAIAGYCTRFCRVCFCVCLSLLSAVNDKESPLTKLSHSLQQEKKQHRGRSSYPFPSLEPATNIHSGLRLGPLGYVTTPLTKILLFIYVTDVYMGYYSFIDPGRMKGWVGLVGWLIADSFPTNWSRRATFVSLSARSITFEVILCIFCSGTYIWSAWCPAANTPGAWSRKNKDTVYWQQVPYLTTSLSNLIRISNSAIAT